MKLFLILFALISLLFHANDLKAQAINTNGLKIWLKNDYGLILSNNKVIEWDDASGNNNNCIQTDTSLQPKLISNINILNNNNSLKFDGVDDFMSFTNGINDIRTIFFVVKHSNGVGAAFEPILGDDINYHFIGDDAGNKIFSATYSSPDILNGNIKVNTVQLPQVINANRPANYSIITLTTVNNVIASRITKDRTISNRVWGGEYSEIIIYNRVLTTVQIDSIENYLHNKYAPSVNLGSDIIISALQGCIPSNSVTIQANPDFQAYLWSNGNTTNQINVNQYGEYSVICTDVFGINHYDTIKVIPTLKNFNYPSNNTLCGTSSFTWSTQLNKSAHQFQWQDNSTDSLIVINNPGQYYVTVTDTFGCVYNSNTLTVIQDNFESSASLGPDLSLCAGNSISLISGASSSNTYTWSTGSNNDSLLINNTGQYSVIVTNTNSCVAKDTINVTITGQAPVANFTTSIGCKNNAVSFTDLSVPPSGNTIASYEWDFGDALSASNTSTLSNPFHTFSDTGNYSVFLKVITNVGCEQSIIKTIHVAPKPLVNFTVGLSCQNDSTSFFGSITNPNGYTTSSLKWNFGDPSSGSANSSTIISPKHLFSNSTNYTIKLVATNNAGCKDSLINIIAVKNQVKADFTYNSACTNTATVFQDNSIVPAPNASNIRSWNFGTSTASGLTVSKSYTNSGVYSVTLSVTGNNGCNSSISKVITIFNPPITSFTIPTFCTKDTVTAINTSIAQSGIISSYNWKLNNASFSSVQNPTLSIASAGNYPVSLTIVNNFGCKDSLTKTITVNPLPIVDFTTNPTAYYYINSPITFSPSISNASFYLWNISTIPTTTIQSPTVTFNSEGSYTASLLLQDQQGCKNSITKNLTVTKRFLDIAILNVNSIKDPDGFVSVQTDIVNYGTIPASSIELNYQVSDGGNIKEIWTGTLVPNAYFTYIFTSKVATQPQSTNHMTCVDAKKVNGISDQKLDNNKLCSALNSTELSVSNPIPNPTNSDITLPIILNKDMDFSISIYNSTGQIIYEELAQKGVTGLNLITLPSSNYSRGCYIIKTMIDDKIFIKKFIKISNE